MPRRPSHLPASNAQLIAWNYGRAVRIATSASDLDGAAIDVSNALPLDTRELDARSRLAEQGWTQWTTRGYWSQ